MVTLVIFLEIEFQHLGRFDVLSTPVQQGPLIFLIGEKMADPEIADRDPHIAFFIPVSQIFLIFELEHDVVTFEIIMDNLLRMELFHGLKYVPVDTQVLLKIVLPGAFLLLPPLFQ